MKEEKRLRRKARQFKRANFFNVLALKIRAFYGIKEPSWSRFKERKSHTPSEDPTMSNKERLQFRRMNNGNYGRKKHGRFTVTNAANA